MTGQALQILDPGNKYSRKTNFLPYSPQLLGVENCAIPGLREFFDLDGRMQLCCYVNSTRGGSAHGAHDAIELENFFPSLKYADPALQDDKELVLAAVKNWGKALEFASVQLRSDREVVLEAVRRCPEMLQFAENGLCADRGNRVS